MTQRRVFLATSLLGGSGLLLLGAAGARAAETAETASAQITIDNFTFTRRCSPCGGARA